MTTIELTPELIFERISDVGSPPSSTLSYNSTGRSSSSGKAPSRRYTDTFPSTKSAATPRKRTLSPSEVGNTVPSSKMDPRNDMALRRSRGDRGYYSLGSGMAKAAQRKKEQADKNASDYGVAISIKGIKGHPFVILEDKENHRHMVPAPEPSDTSDVSSNAPNKGPLQNGTQHDSAPTPQAPPRRAGTLHKDWKDKRDDPDFIKPSSAPTNTAPSKRIPNGPSAPHGERLIKPSDVKAAQKPSTSPSSLHMRSPRARTAHERSRTLPGRRSDAATRSRSLSPNRALASNKPNRSRSVSPPRNKNRLRRVDDNNVQPVSSLIGFFETGPTEPTAKPATAPSKVALIDRGRSTPKKKPTAMASSPVMTDSSKSPRQQLRPRIDSKEIEVTLDSRQTNLTVTTATVTSKHGVAPVGRYFALTSPVATTPQMSLFNQAPHSTPRVASLKGDEASSALSSSSRSSETSMSTDEGTLNLTGDDPTVNTRKSISHDDRSRPELRHISPKPWMSSTKPKSTKSGVSAEPLMKPSEGSSVFGQPEKKVPGYRRVKPVLTKSKRKSASTNERLNNLKKPVDYLSFTQEDAPKQHRKHNWRTTAGRALARGNDALPQAAEDKINEDQIIPIQAKQPRMLFSSLKDKKKGAFALLDLVDRMTSAPKQEKSTPRRKDTVALASLLAFDAESSDYNADTSDKRKVDQNLIQEDLIEPQKARADSTKNNLEDSSLSPASEPMPVTVVSKAKILGPSHQLLQKTKRKRKAQRLSTSNPGSTAVSGSEWSESEYSDAESLGMSLHITDDEYDHEKRFTDDDRSIPDISSPISTGSDSRSHKRPPSIVFGKISSQNTTKDKELDDAVVPVQSDHLHHSSAPTVAELQQHISELRATVKELQQTTDDNLHNYELLNDLQSKLKDVEEEKRMLEEEIVDGRKILKDLEKKLDISQNQIVELRRNEWNDRLLKQQQAKELDDLKSQLCEMNDELEQAKQTSDLRAFENQNEADLMEDMQHLRNEYDELLAKQEERDVQLQKRDDDLQSIKKALRDEASGHDEEVEMMRKMHDDVLSRLRDELETLRQESVSAVEARPRLEDQVALLREELSRLKDQRHQEETWRRSSSSSVDDDYESSAASRARKEAGKNKELLLRSQEELRIAQSTSDELRNEINVLQKKLLNADAQRYGSIDPERLHKLTTALEQVKEEKKNLESNVAALELQRSTLRGQIMEARSEREDGERQIRNLETETTRLKGRIQELENEVERLKKELTRTRRHLEAQVYDLEHQMSDSDRRLSELQAEKANLEKQLSEAKDVTSSDSLLTALHDLEKQKNGLELALSKVRELAASQEEEIEKLEDELRRMSSSTAADAANETLNQLEEFKMNAAIEVESLRADVEAKARALREADRTNNKLQEELRRMDIELEEELKEREATVSEYSQVERTLHELEAKIAEANREKEERDREIEKLQGMLSLTEDDKLNLEEKLDHSETERREVARDLHRFREDVKDKHMEMEELKCRIKAAQSSVEEERSKVSELEHHKYVTELQVSGLKEAMEAKYIELEDAEDILRKMEKNMQDNEVKQEENLRKLRDVEKQRRLAAKEAEDLTLALSEKVAQLDEAQRKLRRLEAQLLEMDEASSLATGFRLELDKVKRSHALELAKAWEEVEDGKSALVTSERSTVDLESELRTYEERYEAAAGEALELERQRRNMAHLASEAQNESKAKTKALAKVEEKLGKIEEELADTECRVDELTNQLREAERSRKEAELSCQDAQSRLADKERDLKDAEKRINRLNQEMDKSNDTSEETRQALVGLEESRKDAQEEISSAKDDIEKLQHQLHDEEEKVNILQGRLTNTDGALRKELERANEAEEELDAARQELDEKNGLLDAAQDAIRNIEKKMKLYEKGQDQKTDQLLKMESDKEEARQRVSDLENQIRANQNEMENVERSMYEAQKDSEASQNRLEDLEEELMQNNAEIRELQKEVEELREAVANRNEDKMKAEDKCEMMQKQVDLLQLEMKQRSDWTERKRAELEVEVHSLEAELRSSEEDLDKMEKEKHDLEDKIAKLEARDLEQQTNADNSQRKEIQQLRDSLDDKTQQVYAAEDTIYRQKEVIEELTSIQQSTEKSSLEQMDAYMAESDKQFEQLKSHLQEKNDLIKAAQHDKDGLEREIVTLSSELEKATSDLEKTRFTYEKEQGRLEEVEQLLKELRVRLKEEQKENSDLREQMSENLRDNSREVDSEDERERSRLEDLVDDMTSRLQYAEEEKEETVNKLEILEDKIGQLHNELEMEKSQVEVLQGDTGRQKQEITKLKEEIGVRQRRNSSSDEDELVASLKDKVAGLEDKLQLEANELNAINTHHRRTEMKLREVLKQAETETNKANSEKEMMSVRMKSLKQQLQEAESQLVAAEEDRRQLQEELREQTEVNYDLKQTLSAHRPPSKTAPSSSSLFTSV